VDRVVQERVLNDDSIARVKIWDRSGRIVYSDEPQLIGKRYPMSPPDRAEFEAVKPKAEVSDLAKPENRYERGSGRLLEVYLPIQTPSGTLLRYETYYRSSFISARAGGSSTSSYPSCSVRSSCWRSSSCHASGSWRNGSSEGRRTGNGS
jgi:two-component system NarL family sensor kinase